MSERDTKFAGFAATLYEKLVRNTVTSDKGLSDVEAFKQEQHQIIAREVYRLLYHAFETMRHSPYREAMEISSTETWIHFIPDFTE